MTKQEGHSVLGQEEEDAADGKAESPAYRVAYPHHNIPARLPADTLYTLWVTVENQGTAPWLPHPQEGYPPLLSVFLDDTHIHYECFPQQEVAPGERVTLGWAFRTPPTVGQHELKLDIVDQGSITLESQGALPLMVPFETTPAAPTESGRLMDWARERNPWHFRPSQGQGWSRAGPAYPLFAREAKGCRVTDLEGRTYLDYIMGWGCALLGYAHPRVQRAVHDALDSAAVIPLPSYLEMEVTRLLCEDIPCAEAVTFGKNGSDVCTLAVRLARASTGRERILTCGYHGWQDWYVEPHGLAFAGVPSRPEPLVFHFRYGDIEEFERLLHGHRDQVAAVMLEPAGPADRADPAGMFRDADPVFLRALAEAARRAGAVLIFDEIVTGFRHPGGGVQKATGVVPDLACFGKALSNGMPLSALVGRRDLMQRWMGRTYYGTTFQSEVYSFAAAREALMIYRESDVAAHVWSFGTRLKEGVNALCRRLGVPAELTGLPYRMMLTYTGPDPRLLPLMQTLMEQELLKQGVLTLQGIFMPSLAHDDGALTETLRAFEHAARVVAEAAMDDPFARFLEIPLLTW